MTRILWLVYERVPHPDAVSFPAGNEDVRLVLELLGRPYPGRLHAAEQLRNFLKQQEALPAFGRRQIPCRRASGLYHPVPWRLAKWLSRVLTAPDAVVDRTVLDLRQWLDDGATSAVHSTEPYR